MGKLSLPYVRERWTSLVNDFSSVIRYGLPGWTFLLVLLLPHVLSLAFDAPVQTTWVSVGAVVQSGTVTALGGLAVVFSIPVGFLIYQVYFCMDWLTARFEDWAGWSEIPVDTAKGSRIEKQVAKVKDTHEAWFVVEQYWYALLLDRGKDAIGLISGRSSRLFDLYHALGATSWAVIVGLLVHVFMFGQWPLVWQKETAFPMLLLLALVLTVVYRNRKYTRRNLIQFQNGVIRTLEERPGNK